LLGLCYVYFTFKACDALLRVRHRLTIGKPSAPLARHVRIRAP
jgi:hypothetical protein